MQRRCDRLIAGLNVPLPFDMETFIARSGETLGRPIVPIPMSLPPHGPSGLLIQTKAKDYILFQRLTSRVHQENIILHELAHRFCDHKGIHDLDENRALALFPDLQPDTVISMLRRSAYADHQEHEAEFFASMLRIRMASWAPHPNWSISSEIAEAVERIERVLGSPR
ncbi:hypothetical protein DFR76_107368 [Nocardia pseudobrasiliensis]|uniref:IrrE N-terminal-like domain-containing protein n=2 Tax=Nocardia pseudobrasiliensis TaxID=45979 RepID=A0A370I337_9NOCA|nr:hypothetical protein DFR76_107368 [Nocardia pseudobrasiliensis]